MEYGVVKTNEKGGKVINSKGSKVGDLSESYFLSVYGFFCTVRGIEKRSII